MKLNRKLLPLLLVAAGTLLVAAPSARADDDRSQVELRLTVHDDDSDLRLGVKYEHRETSGGVRSKLNVRLKKGMPGDSHDVAVNGLFLGTIVLDDEGEGRLRLRSEDMPVDLPSLQEGDVVTAGPLGGAVELHGKWRHQRRHGGDDFRLTLADRTSDDAGVKAVVKYKVRVRDEAMRRRLKVAVEDAAEGDTYDVLLNGTFLGAIVIDAFGEGELKLRSENADEAFPMLQAGDVFLVGGYVLQLG